MSRIDDTTLQRYYDRALPDEERRAVEARLTEDDRLRLAALGELSLAVRGALEGAADDAGGVDLWAGIAARLEAQAPKVASLEAARARRRARWLGPSAGLLAAAAAVLLLVRPWQPPTAGSNGCDIESLEVDGLVATVITPEPGEGDGPTIIWTNDEGEN